MKLISRKWSCTHTHKYVTTDTHIPDYCESLLFIFNRPWTKRISTIEIRSEHCIMAIILLDGDSRFTLNRQKCGSVVSISLHVPSTHTHTHTNEWDYYHINVLNGRLNLNISSMKFVFFLIFLFFFTYHCSYPVQINEFNLISTSTQKCMQHTDIIAINCIDSFSC